MWKRTEKAGYGTFHAFLHSCFYSSICTRHAARCCRIALENISRTGTLAADALGPASRHLPLAESRAGWLRLAESRVTRPTPRRVVVRRRGACDRVWCRWWLRCAMALLAFLCAAALAVLARGTIPPPEEAARMARFVLHNCDWGALATLSAQEGLRGRPFANIFSISDGAPGPGGGSGVPYLYLTDMEISVQDLEINSNASLTVSLAQTPYCKKHRYDPQNPLCAHIIFCGSVVKVNDSEAGLAKKALFTRHPEMESWPKDHNWFFAKFNITNIWVLDYFGGLKIVTPEEYYNVKP